MTYTLTTRSRGRDILSSLIVGIGLTALSYVTAILFHWQTAATVNWLEVFAVFTSYVCTYLCVRERRINYPIGAISSAAYSYLFWQSGLFSSALLNAYLVPTLVYGWIRWRQDSATRPVTHIRLKWIPVYLLISIAGYLGAAVLSRLAGGTLAWSDALILAGTILAQFLLDNKKLENWLVWAVVNVFAIYTYAAAGLRLAAFQYIFFLANTIFGYVIWQRSLHYGKSIRTDDGYAPDNRALAAGTVR